MLTVGTKSTPEGATITVGDHPNNDLAMESLSTLYSAYTDGKTLGCLYIAERNPALQPGAPVGEAELTTALEAAILPLGIRNFILTDGYCVVDERMREPLRHYAAYAEKQGLVSGPEDGRSAFDRVLFVKDIFDSYVILQAIAEAGKRIFPYRHSGMLTENAEKFGVELVGGSSSDVAADVNDFFYHKGNYQFEVAKVQDAPFERVYFYADKKNDPFYMELQRENLEAALAYAARYDHDFAADPAKKVLFVQGSLSAGGFGNRIITMTEDGHFQIPEGEREPTVVPSVAALWEYIANSWSVDAQISPYVPIAKTYSIGVVVGDNVVASLGPREQILDPDTNSYQGWKVDVNSKTEDFVRLDEQITVALELGARMHSLGFRGCFGEDLFEFIDSDKKLDVARAEMNVRMDATSMLIGCILRHEELRPLFLSSALSVRQDDHFHISERTASQTGNTFELAERIRSSGIPLASGESPFGVWLLSPMATDPAGDTSMILAVIAKDDATRDAWYEGLKQLVG